MKTYTKSVLSLILLIGSLASAAPDIELSRYDSREDQQFDIPAPTAEEDDFETTSIVSETDIINEMTDQFSNENLQEQATETHKVTNQDFGKPITHGTTIALQVVFMKMTYLSCRSRNCNRYSCPHLYMDKGDWTNCYGEVFEIYRRKGAGLVRVGDDIGLYYPRESGKWFGCAGSKCNKATCPGKHSCNNGFSTPDRWNVCWGEVFKIYARGKLNGEVIRVHDHILLYYPRAKNWIGVSGRGGYAEHRTCPGGRLPPPADKFDRCWGEIFELWAQ